MRLHQVLSLVLFATTAAACSSHKSSGCNPADPGACSGGAVCEPVASGGTGCFAPLALKGQVTDLANGAGLDGARVVALDANRAPASAVATTSGGGNYTLSVPATRASNGAPTGNVTLRADAKDYQSFPGGVRSALPIDLSTATYSSSASRWEVQGTLTDVGLIHLLDASNLVSISGTIQQPSTRVGLLVMAQPQAGGIGLTAIADRSGSYTIFNVPAAASPGITYTVNAYGRGVNYNPETATLTVGSDATVDLTIKNTTTANVAGSLIFTSSATPPTSVALVLEPTYNVTLDRGESPPGLVAQIPSGGTYTIAGVPDGTYIALAAFGIDGNVRDVSDTGNTAPVEVVIDNGVGVTLGQFKVTGAVELTKIDGVSVGAGGDPTQISTTTPTFEWAKASSSANTATYLTDVYDAFGTNVWTNTTSPSGPGPYTATYAGDTLQSGMYYQLRVKALDNGGTAQSQTEDLKGVFFLP